MLVVAMRDIATKQLRRVLATNCLADVAAGERGLDFCVKFEPLGSSSHCGRCEFGTSAGVSRQLGLHCIFRSVDRRGGTKANRIEGSRSSVSFPTKFGIFSRS